MFERFKLLRTLDDEHTKSLYSPSVPIAFPPLQKPLSSVFPNRVYPASIRMHSKSTQRKLANHKNHHVVKFQDEVWLLSLKRTIWKQRRNSLSSEKGLQLLAVITTPVINTFLDMEQVVLVPASVYNKSVTTQSVTKQQFLKCKAEQPPTYQIDFLKRDINKKLFGKTDTLIDKILSCSCIKFSNSQTIILYVVDTGVLIADFTIHLRRKNADVPDIYFTLLDAAGTSPSLVFNQNAKAKDRGS